MTLKASTLIRHSLLCTGLAVLLLSIGCKEKKKEAPKQQGPNATIVDVIIASTQAVSNTVEANGTVIPAESIEIRPEVSGRLTFLNIPEGARVTKGTVLARINDADLQAQLNKTKSQLDLAEKNEARLRRLVAINGINQADYDAVVTQVNNLKADMDFYKAQIEKTYIKAPFDGLLGLRQVSPGAYVTPANIFATLQQVDRSKIDFTVPERYADFIRKGATIQITAGAQNNKRSATIIATEPEINATTRNLKVRAMVNGAPIQPGSFVKVYLNAGGSNSSILVPTNSIIPDARSKQVAIVKDGKGLIVNVETGIRSSGYVEVTKGLRVGDSVVVTGVLFVRPNSNVKVRSVKQLKDILQ